MLHDAKLADKLPIDLQHLERLAGEIDEFLKSAEGKSILKRFKKNNRILIIDICFNETHVAAFIVWGKGLCEVRSPKISGTYSLPPDVNPLQGKQLGPRAFLEAVTRWPDRPPIKAIRDGVINDSLSGSRGELRHFDESVH